MYFRRNDGKVSYTKGEPGILLEEDAAVYLDTYFNGFSIGKWRKYTRIEQVNLTLRFRGKARVTLLWNERSRGQVIKHYLEEKVLESDGGEVSLPFWESGCMGIYSADILALEDTVLYGGYYWTGLGEEQTDSVRLALDICTFRREEFVKRNMALLGKTIFEKEMYRELRGGVRIYVVDNAGTLEKNELTADSTLENHICLIKNRNVGGSGGFTRGLLEIRRDMEKYGHTHALLMDDDIVIEPEAVFRTWRLLSLLKEEYKGAFVGGAMLRLDFPYLQTESGAAWNSGDLISRKQGMDLRFIEACLFNEIEESVDFAAWWFCAVPLSVVRDDNLPIPVFIRGDDVEYGLRNAKNIIALNGICVWHEPFENKYSSAMYYYILRNRLIDNALHGRELEPRSFIRVMRNWVKSEVYLYRYKNARLLLQGVADYYKGIDWLKEQDGETLHGRVMGGGYRLQPVQELDAVFDFGMLDRARKDSDSYRLSRRVLRRTTLNGTFLKPRRRQGVVPTVDTRYCSVYRTEKILNYDEASRRGFVTVRDKKEARACMRQLRRLIRKTKRVYGDVNREYRERGREMMRRDFWERYLGMEEETNGRE